MWSDKNCPARIHYSSSQDFPQITLEAMVYPALREKEGPVCACVNFPGNRILLLYIVGILKKLYITINGWSLQGTVCQWLPQLLLVVLFLCPIAFSMDQLNFPDLSLKKELRAAVYEG